MSKEAKSLKRLRKERDRAMHNAAYVLDKELQAMNRERQFVATAQNGDIGVLAPGGAELAKFMDEAKPGDVFVDKAVQGDLTQQGYEAHARQEAVIDYLNDIGAYPVSSSSSSSVPIDPSKPIEITFTNAAEPRDYQDFAIAAVSGAEGEHLPRTDFGGVVVVCDSISPVPEEDIVGEVVGRGSRHSILLKRPEEVSPPPVIDLDYAGIPGRVIDSKE